MPFSPSMKQMADCAAMTPSSPLVGAGAGGGATDMDVNRSRPREDGLAWPRDLVGRFIPLAVPVQPTAARGRANRQVAGPSAGRRGGLRLRAPRPLGRAAREHPGLVPG